MMITVEISDAVANNPAGRVLAFLRDFEAKAKLNPAHSAMAFAADILGDEQESVRTYLLLTHLRMQAESVPDLMEPYAQDFGYRSTFKYYGQIVSAARRLQTPAGSQAQAILTSVTDGGWAALEYSAEVLAHNLGEPELKEDQQKDFLEQVRSLIDEVSSDATLSPADRTRVINLLRAVEQALLDIKINGTQALQEAVAAAGAVVRASPDLWERLSRKKWIRRFATTLAAMFLALDAGANALAIEQYFGGDPQETITVVEKSERIVDAEIVDEENPG